MCLTNTTGAVMFVITRDNGSYNVAVATPGGGWCWVAVGTREAAVRVIEKVWWTQHRLERA